MLTSGTQQAVHTGSSKHEFSRFTEENNGDPRRQPGTSPRSHSCSGPGCSRTQLSCRVHPVFQAGPPLPRPTSRIRFRRAPEKRTERPLPHGQNVASLAQRRSSPGITPGAPGLPRKGSGLPPVPGDDGTAVRACRAQPLPRPCPRSTHTEVLGSGFDQPLCSRTATHSAHQTCSISPAATTVQPQTIVGASLPDLCGRPNERQLPPHPGARRLPVCPRQPKEPDAGA